MQAWEASESTFESQAMAESQHLSRSYAIQLEARYTHEFYGLQSRYGGYVIGIETNHQIGRLFVEVRQIALLSLIHI